MTRGKEEPLDGHPAEFLAAQLLPAPQDWFVSQGARDTFCPCHDDKTTAAAAKDPAHHF